MTVKAKTWRELVNTLREQGLGKTKGFIKKSEGVWTWRSL